MSDTELEAPGGIERQLAGELDSPLVGEQLDITTVEAASVTDGTGFDIAFAAAMQSRGPRLIETVLQRTDAPVDRGLPTVLVA